jgi:hypothetical protein
VSSTAGLLLPPLPPARKRSNDAICCLTISRRAWQARQRQSLCFCTSKGSQLGIFLAYVSIRQHTPAYVSIRQHTSASVSICQHSVPGRIGAVSSAYVSIRQHTSAYVSLRQHTSAYVSMACLAESALCRHFRLQLPEFFLFFWHVLLLDERRQRLHLAVNQRCLLLTCIRQHTSAYVSIRQHTSADVSRRQHTSAYVSIR